MIDISNLESAFAFFILDVSVGNPASVRGWTLGRDFQGELR